MKRINFKAELVPPILSGEKKATSRWRNHKWAPGEVRAAVAASPGRPAFLTPATEAFAMLRCTSAIEKFWMTFTDEDAVKCGVTREWYLKERPQTQDMDLIHIYEFEKVEP